MTIGLSAGYDRFVQTDMDMFDEGGVVAQRRTGETRMARDDEWQIEGNAAELFERYVVPAITALWAADLVGRAAPQPGERVLDVACGTGVVARLAARTMGAGRVVGLDINAAMLSVARLQPALPAPAIEWVEASALQMPLPDRSFDLVLCQLGLQFFPDRSRALQEMLRVLVPKGRLALSVFTAIERTPIAKALVDSLDRHLGPGASTIKRSEHALYDAGELRRLVTETGFRDVTIQAVTLTIRFPSARDYVRLQLLATPQAGLLKGMDGARRDALVGTIAADIAASLGGVAADDEIASPQEVHVAVARK